MRALLTDVLLNCSLFVHVINKQEKINMDIIRQCTGGTNKHIRACKKKKKRQLKTYIIQYIKKSIFLEYLIETKENNKTISK